jgi:hypothetical protein
MKNKWEEVIFLISEKQYNTYTQKSDEVETVPLLPQNLLDEKSLVSTMSISEKWIYLLFDKDIR